MKKIKVALIGPANSIHLLKWANELNKDFCDVTVLSQHFSTSFNYKCQCIHLPYKGPLGYVLNFIALRNHIRELNPEIVHVHYATGYGFLSRLSKIRVDLISVWGSDVFEFPKKSFFHKKILIKNLINSRFIASTSIAMKDELSTIYKFKKKIFITPFGVDTEKFKPLGNIQTNEEIVIGTVKTLDHKYGIDTLIKGFCEALKLQKVQNPFIKMKLVIVGDGPDLNKLQTLTKDLNISNNVFFKGKIDNDLVAKELCDFDIFVAVSRSESFGVAVLEASSCEIPVIVSNVGGLPEVVINEYTGLIIPSDDPHLLSIALKKMIADKNRSSLGKNGREFVLKNFSNRAVVKNMIDIYNQIKTT